MDRVSSSRGAAVQLLVRGAICRGLPLYCLRLDAATKAAGEAHGQAQQVDDQRQQQQEDHQRDQADQEAHAAARDSQDALHPLWNLHLPRLLKMQEDTHNPQDAAKARMQCACLN